MDDFQEVLKAAKLKLDALIQRKHELTGQKVSLNQQKDVLLAKLQSLGFSTAKEASDELARLSESLTASISKINSFLQS